MDTRVLETKRLLTVEQGNADLTFWCEPVDLADKTESSSRGKDFESISDCSPCYVSCVSYSCNCS